MEDRMLIDEANGLCAMASEDGCAEFAYCAPVRMFAETLWLRIGGEWRKFALDAHARWQHSGWIETFAVRADLRNCQSVFYRLHGDRVVAGELRTERA